MKYYLFTAFLSLVLQTSFSQFGQLSPALYHDPNGGDTIYMHTDVEELAEYASGREAFNQEYFGYLKYPAAAREKGIQGNVILSFVVEKDGTATDLKVVRSAHPTLDGAALAAFKNLGKWKPAMIKGEPVRCQVLLPVKFTLG